MDQISGIPIPEQQRNPAGESTCKPQLRFVVGRMRGAVRKEDAIQNEVRVLFATAGSEVSTESILTWIHFPLVPLPKCGKVEKLIS